MEMYNKSFLSMLRIYLVCHPVKADGKDSDQEENTKANDVLFKENVKPTSVKDKKKKVSKVTSSDNETDNEVANETADCHAELTEVPNTSTDGITVSTDIPSTSDGDVTDKEVINPPGEVPFLTDQEVINPPGEVPFNILDYDLGENVSDAVPDVLVLQPPIRAFCAQKPLKIQLKRGQIFEDFVNAADDFDVNSFVEVTLIRSNGTKEFGEDSGGLLRDALSEFWEDFMLKYTSGEDIKVPEIVHTMQEKRWTNVAKILVIGFRQANYFPINLAMPFMEVCIFETSSDESLVPSLLNYMSTTDSDVIRRALSDFSSVTTDEVMEALEDFSVRKMLSKDNLPKVLNEVAHAKLIQEPAYVADIWRPIFQCHLKTLIPTRKKLEEIYENMVPTVRRLLKLIHFPTLDAPNKEHEYLENMIKKFIKSLDKSQCKKFLRFCTGSDLIAVEKIEVRFVLATSSFARVPVAHTCGCVLDIPSGDHGYGTYNELKTEFQKVIESGYLETDFV